MAFSAGSIGGQLLGLPGVATGSGGMDIGSLAGNITCGDAGGGVLLPIIGFVRTMLAK